LSETIQGLSKTKLEKTPIHSLLSFRTYIIYKRSGLGLRDWGWGWGLGLHLIAFYNKVFFPWYSHCLWSIPLLLGFFWRKWRRHERLWQIRVSRTDFLLADYWSGWNLLKKRIWMLGEQLPAPKLFGTRIHKVWLQSR